MQQRVRSTLLVCFGMRKSEGDAKRENVEFRKTCNHICPALYLRRLKMTMLPWPPQSPDLHPIAHVWAYIKWQLSLYETAPETLEDLWERVQAIWTNIPIDFLERLYES